MISRAQDFASLHFSTGHLAPSKRLPALRELFDRSIGFDLEAEPGHAIDMEMHVAPGLRRAKMLSSLTARITRPARRVVDGEDTVCLMIKMGGHMAMTQGRNEGVPQVGDAVLLVYRRPALIEFVDARYVSVRVPLSALAGLADVENAAALRIPGSTEALSQLRTYIANLPHRIADPRLGSLTATHVYDLMALAIGATKEGRDIASQRGLRAARLEAIKASLIADVSLDLETLAARQRISPRYVQKLFEEADTTFSEFALAQRLDAARKMLTSPRFQSWTITAIAFEVGFLDLSHFNRRFKQRYSMTPTDMRNDSTAAGG